MSKVWFVTGSSRGLGRAIVVAALEAGDRVVATARKPAQLDDLVARHGDRIHPVGLDVTDPEQVHSAVQEGLKVFGRYDVVVNNAGYADLASVEDVTVEDFRAQIDTNLYGVVHVSKAVLPLLREQGSGHIFQVSSVGGRIGSVGLAAYQSAKWAVGGFSTVLAQEVAPFGIKVTVLEPGAMRTDWAGSSMTVPPVSEPYQQTVGGFADMVKSLTETASAHSADPARIARTVVDLAGRDDAPLRLLLGRDAVQYGGAAARQLAESDEKWRPVSESVWD
ncbi:SDR family NAD(P)-dependent oxidoreductase [Streptomyces nodosus]|uniref:Oxidoreductase n=1 Tax=Streptomyces nodosus TaxID=40318 RepID=A0A0B5DM54_9ACTN|nr:SDR family NAD(P)-dependent oxidoreductase [Streptomyces nodosus]AJE44299.1 oxidoreductase [Streptomyces nodosus]MBB4795925.1 NAD(P)-dependent dehydrogenase (short-subunit alcohol dehydrogenase family) [Streptomyces nodosus]QEV42790.1 SDR family NAD(P)-dependent oxidoreductase [Streptomyces nodosus]